MKGTTTMIRRSMLVAAAALLTLIPVAASAQNTPIRFYRLLDTRIGDFVLNRTTVANIMGPFLRRLPLTDGKTVSGIALGTAAGTPAGAVGVSRTAGTSLVLLGEVTSSNAKTDSVIFEYTLPDTYLAGSNIPLVINAAVSGSGTLTAASTTITPTVYALSGAGVETAVTVSAAQQIVAAGSSLTFTITGTTLVAGQRIVISIAMLVTTSSGANTGSIRSVALTS